MPIVRVEMLAGRDPAIKQRIATEITEVMVRHSGADAAHIYVMFSDVAHADWAVAGRFFPTPATPAKDS